MAPVALMMDLETLEVMALMMVRKRKVLPVRMMLTPVHLAR